MIESGFPDYYLLSDLYLFSFFSLHGSDTDFHLGSKPRRGIGLSILWLALEMLLSSFILLTWCYSACWTQETIHNGFPLDFRQIEGETPHNDLEERKGVLFRDKFGKKSRSRSCGFFSHLSFAHFLADLPSTFLYKVSNIFVVESGEMVLVTKDSMLLFLECMSPTFSCGLGWFFLR